MSTVLPDSQSSGKGKAEPEADIEDVEDVQSEQAIKTLILEATERKQEATEYFHSGKWTEAIAAYRTALACLPHRPSRSNSGKGKGRTSPSDATEDPDTAESTCGAAVPTTPLQQECAKLRAVLNANIGACNVKLEEYSDAVDACSEAIADDPTYIKAIMRRAQANEKINSWSSLSSAQEDYNALLKLLPKESSQVRDVERALRQLEPRIEVVRQRDLDEMVGKLKSVGNTILGKFGLSTDNFKMEPNGQGGYSMNFVR